MNEINIFISGDFSPVRGAEEKLLNGYGSQEIFDGLNEVIQEADISITNLECPLTLVNDPINKLGPNLRSNPKIAKVLKENKFDLITLANNHIYDYGEKGLKDTIESLEKYGLDYVGAGESLNDAKNPYFVNVKDLKLAFLNFAEIEFSCANENHGGANPLDLIDNLSQIKSAKEKADKVIVVIHGGHEYHHYPSPETQKRYRFLAENGADVIVGHHTHCIGGHEIYEGVPIFYSLGNFLFPPRSEKKPESWYEGYSVLLKIKENEIDFEILPYEQCKDGKVSIEPKSKNSLIYDKIEEVSRGLKDDELIRSKWDEYVENKKRFLSHMSGYNKYVGYALMKTGLMKYFLNKNKLRYIKQFITCQAHSETARELLRKYLKF